MRVRANILRFLLLAAFIMCGFNLYAQDTTESKAKKPIDVDFLLNYYEQDGNHSPVTGGIGTEKLSNIDNAIIIHIPIDSTGKLSISNSMNYYTSASTDMIDTKMSSASRSDLHWQVDLKYEREKPSKNRSLSLTAGASTESDYISSSIGIGYGKWSADKNNYLNASFKAYFDTWILIFPQELRETALSDVPTDKRKSYILNLGYTRVFTKRIQGSFFVEPVYQSGMLATPFHRVYFGDSSLVKIEKLPTSRFKLPMGLRLNSFIGNFLVLRLYNRFYWDDFGIISNTTSIEPVFKINSTWSVYPFYRYYKQSAANYFAPYQTHLVSDEFYTSDYDLSAFDSHKLGLGLQFSPVWVKKTSENKTNRRALRSIGIRYSRYYRSDGLEYWMISSGLSFSF